MDFFEAQEAAHRRTGLLVGLFAFAVLAIVAVVYVVVHVGTGTGGGGIDPVLLAQVALGVGLVIAIGSGIRTASLRSGGPAVAELLGARRVPSDTSDLQERTLLNVVEEMSIASGTPMPAVYVMDTEDGINAFAAGYSTHDAAVAVTRGALRSLDRSELQGVIAHEFSHILNGDMRLNVRLIGILYGILLLAVIGRGLLYATPRGGGTRRGRGEGGAGWILLLGVVLLLVGYIGVFFGKIIKAAVSRQREFLADSAAVQFTRDPEALAGALKKIGAQVQGSRVHNHHAEELSHLFFANGVRRSFAGLLATHPPLDDRIRRLDPAWSGGYVPASPRKEAPVEAHRPSARRHGFEESAGAAGVSALAPAALVASVGAPTADHLAFASKLLAELPERLGRAVHDPLESRALVFALVLADGERGGVSDLEIPQRYGGRAFGELVLQLLGEIRALAHGARLPLLDLALPAMGRMSPGEVDRFRGAVEEAIQADGEIHLFEYALSHTLARRLSGPGHSERGGRRIGRPAEVRQELQLLLSAVAWAGAGGDPEAAARAFAAGSARLPAEGEGFVLRNRADLTLPRIDQSLSELQGATPALKKIVLEAMAESVALDGRVDRAETELLRAVSESLDCPIPPLLAG